MAGNGIEPGDVVVVDGETYQVLESTAAGARLIPFPSEIIEGHEMTAPADGWQRIGQAPLPAPAPCAADGCCPTDGRIPDTDD